MGETKNYRSSAVREWKSRRPGRNAERADDEVRDGHVDAEVIRRRDTSSVDGLEVVLGIERQEDEDMSPCGEQCDEAERHATHHRRICEVKIANGGGEGFSCKTSDESPGWPRVVLSVLVNPICSFHLSFSAQDKWDARGPKETPMDRLTSRIPSVFGFFVLSRKSDRIEAQFATISPITNRVGLFFLFLFPSRRTSLQIQSVERPSSEETHGTGQAQTRARVLR